MNHQIEGHALFVMAGWLAKAGRWYRPRARTRDLRGIIGHELVPHDHTIGRNCARLLRALRPVGIPPRAWLTPHQEKMIAHAADRAALKAVQNETFGTAFMRQPWKWRQGAPKSAVLAPVA